MKKYRKIPSLNLMYEITIDGKLRNTKSKKHKKREISKDGYAQYKCYVKGKPYRVKEHRLVYETWGKDFNKDLTINHKDFNKLNNHISNLEQMTHQENHKHWREAHKGKVIKNASLGGKARSEKEIERVWNKEKWLVNNEEMTLNEAYQLILKENIYNPSKETFRKAVWRVNKGKRKMAYKKTWKKSQTCIDYSL